MKDKPKEEEYHVEIALFSDGFYFVVNGIKCNKAIPENLAHLITEIEEQRLAIIPT